MKRLLAILLLCLPAASVHAQDSGGEIKVTTIMHEDGTRTVTTTNKDEHTSESVTYGAKDKVTQRIVYTLDEEDVALSGLVYGPNGKIVFKAVYKRDGSNRVVEEIDSAPDGTLLRRFVYEYGANGKVSRVRAYDAAGNEMRPTQSPAKKDERKTAPRKH